MSIFLFALASLGLAAWAGIRFYSLPVWDWIDTVYFPLAAVALVLFFTSNEVHHNFLNVSQNLLTKRIGTNQRQARSLGIAKLDSLMPTEDILAEFKRIEEFTRYARTCGNYPVTQDSQTAPAKPPLQTGSEAKCVAARKFLSGLQILDVTLRREQLTLGERPVDKLFAGCNAADAMVDEFVLGGRVSNSVAEGTADIYKSYRKKEIGSIRVREEILPKIQQHVATVKSQIASGMQESGANATGPENRTVKVRLCEAEISGLVLESRLPCTEFASIDLEALREVIHRDSLFAVR